MEKEARKQRASFSLCGFLALALSPLLNRLRAPGYIIALLSIAFSVALRLNRSEAGPDMALLVQQAFTEDSPLYPMLKSS